MSWNSKILNTQEARDINKELELINYYIQKFRFQFKFMPGEEKKGYLPTHKLLCSEKQFFHQMHWALGSTYAIIEHNLGCMIYEMLYKITFNKLLQPTFKIKQWMKDATHYIYSYTRTCYCSCSLFFSLFFYSYLFITSRKQNMHFHFVIIPLHLLSWILSLQNTCVLIQSHAHKRRE